jgi:hypothetical protein
MPQSVIFQATLFSVLFYGGVLLVAGVACWLTTRRESRNSTTWWVAGAGLLLAASPWLLDGVLPAVDAEWAPGPAPTAELRTAVWQDPLIGVAVSEQQPRAGGAFVNRTVHWASPARTLMMFLAHAGGLLALGTFPGGPRVVVTRGAGLGIRLGTTAKTGH